MDHECDDKNKKLEFKQISDELLKLTNIATNNLLNENKLNNNNECLTHNNNNKESSSIIDYDIEFYVNSEEKLLDDKNKRQQIYTGKAVIIKNTANNMLNTSSSSIKQFDGPIKNVRTNKTFLARFGNNTKSNQQQQQSASLLNNSENSEQIQIKCINELPKQQQQQQKKKTKSTNNNSSATKHNTNVNASPIGDISIISHHSSVTNSKDDSNSSNSSKSNIELIKQSEFCVNKPSKQQAYYHDQQQQNEFENDDDNKENDDILTIYAHNDSQVNKPYFTEIKKHVMPVIEQGREHDNHLSNVSYDQTPSNDVNICKYGQDKSKIRSQFMQRFAGVQKRQIIPQMIINENEGDTNKQRSNSQDEKFRTKEIQQPTQTQPHHQSPLHNVDSLTTSLAASLAVTVTQPFLKIQNDLENKMDTVMKRLDSLQKSDVVNKQPNEFDYDSERRRVEDDMHNLIDMKLKYIERLQENQFQLMTQMMGMIGKENVQQNMEQTQEKLNELLNEYKQELKSIHNIDNYEKMKQKSLFQSKSNMAMNRHNYDEYANTQVRSRKHQESPTKRTKSRSRSESKKQKKSHSRSKNDSKSRSPSKSRIDTFEPEYGCLRCRQNECSKHAKSAKKQEFLEELLDYASPAAAKLNNSRNELRKSTEKLDEKEHENRSINTATTVIKRADDININNNSSSSLFKKSTIDTGDNELLFDKYLLQARSLDQMLQTSMKTSSTISEADNDKKNTKIAQSHRHLNSSSKSSFTDIEERLKEIESSKKLIDENINALWRNRDKTFMYSLESSDSLTDKEQKEKIRIRKLVDGYLNAVSSDVQKEVLQELIDKSKHAKLEAERDLNDQKRARFRAQSNPIVNKFTTTQAKPIKTSEKYFKSVYGKDLYDKVKKGDIKAFNWTNEENLSNSENLNRLDEDIFDKIIAKPVPKPVVSKIPIKNSYPKRSTPIARPPSKPVGIKRPIQVQQPPPPPPTVQPPQPKQTSNVALVNIPYKEEKKKPKLRMQSLPPVNISAAYEKIVDEPKQPSPRKDNYEEDFESDENESINESGVGITYPGYKPPPKLIDQERDDRPVSSKYHDKQSHIIQPSSDELAQKLKSKDLLENKALDWIEQELMARFVSTVVRQEEPERVRDPVVEITRYTDDDDDESSERTLSFNENVILNAIGEHGFQLFVDSGQQIDPDLIQALAREVLEEKINSMIGNNRLFTDDEQPDKQKITTPRPQPRSFERISLNDNNVFTNVERVETPQPTPVHSPRASPRPSKRPVTPPLSPQVSVIEEVDNIPPQKPQVIPQVIEVDEETESLIESLDHGEDEEVELIIDQKLKIIPKTPDETPRQSPSPPSTPTLSQPILPPPPPPPVIIAPPPPQKKLVTVSVQCDPEPKPKPVKPITPTPVQKEEPKKIVESDSSESLTESSSYSSDASSTAEKSDDEEDTYMSDGAWLMSKSEGQIIVINNNDPNKFKNIIMANSITEVSTSEGEVKPTGNIFQVNKLKSVNGGVSESGEIPLKLLNGVSNSLERSDGEIENGNSYYDVKKNSFNNTERNNKKLPQKNQTDSPAIDKTVVNLRVSSGRSSKNNIHITSFPNEVNLRDSKDFEKRVISSTPDSSAVFSSQNRRLMELPHEVADFRITPTASHNYDDELTKSNKNYEQDDYRKSKITISIPDNTSNYKDDEQDTLSNTSYNDEIQN